MTRCILLLALAAAPMTQAFGQSPETVLTQTLITEIRALRQEIEATTIASQRVQIALYRLQSQTALMAGAQQRLDAARQRMIEIQAHRRMLTERLQRFEGLIPNTQDPAQKKEFEAGVAGTKVEMEGVAAEESVRRGAEAEAESQFRAEQARLADLQALLDRLDKALEELARPKK